MVDIWREKVPVRFGSVDRSDRLTLWSIFNFFQEAAISHAADLGVGREDLASKRQAWIISRLSLFIERRPVFGEIMQVSTWPRGSDKLFALRDYEIRDGENRAVVRGRAAWLVIDVDKRRPIRAQAVVDKLPLNDGIDAFPEGPAALKARDKLEKKGCRIALYSDIDYFGHANNARYIQWIQDVSDMDVLTNADRIRFDINYLSEVMPGETVELWTSSFEDTVPGFAYEGRKPGSDQTAFRAELIIGQNNTHAAC